MGRITISYTDNNVSTIFMCANVSARRRWNRSTGRQTPRLENALNLAVACRTDNVIIIIIIIIIITAPRVTCCQMPICRSDWARCVSGTFAKAVFALSGRVLRRVAWSTRARFRYVRGGMNQKCRRTPQKKSWPALWKDETVVKHTVCLFVCFFHVRVPGRIATVHDETARVCTRIPQHNVRFNDAKNVISASGNRARVFSVTRERRRRRNAKRTRTAYGTRINRFAYVYFIMNIRACSVQNAKLEKRSHVTDVVTMRSVYKQTSIKSRRLARVHNRMTWAVEVTMFSNDQSKHGRVIQKFVS